MKVKSELVGGSFVFIITLVIFLFSHVHQLADSNYSMLVSESLLHHRSFALDYYNIPRFPLKSQDGFLSNGDIYQLEVYDNHLYYWFPNGSAILSVPYVALLNALGISASNPDGTYNPNGEIKIEASLAAFLMAGFACMIFYTSRLLLPFGYSLLIAFGGALGTQTWSTASRALWSDTWGIFLLGFVVWMLLAQETARRQLQPELLATLLSWSYFARPTNNLSIIAMTIYVLLFQRRIFIRYALTGATWFALFVAYSWNNFGKFQPSYYRAGRLSFNNFWEALAGNLISPSRGLLIFVPVLLFVAYLLIRYRATLFSRRLLFICLFIIFAHLIVVSGFSPWWGGYCFGPRYTTGLVPFFALLAILGVQAWRKYFAENNNSLLRQRVEVIIGAVLLTCSMTINARGATAHRTWLWNDKPVNVDEQPSRV